MGVEFLHGVEKFYRGEVLFVQAAYILYAGSDFFHPEELAPHAKNNECVVIDVYKFGQEFFIIGIFGKFLYKYLKTILAKAA